MKDTYLLLPGQQRSSKLTRQHVDLMLLYLAYGSPDLAADRRLRLGGSTVGH